MNKDFENLKDNERLFLNQDKDLLEKTKQTAIFHGENGEYLNKMEDELL